MSVQPINFPMLGEAQTNPEFAGMRFTSDMFSNILKQRLAGLEAEKAQKLLPFVEPQAQADLQKAILANAYQQIVNKNAPEDYRTTFAQRGAQTRKLNQQADYPLLSLPGVAGQIGAELWLKKNQPALYNQSNNPNNANSLGGQTSNDQVNNGSPDYADLLHQNISANLRKNVVETALKDAQTKGYNWGHMTAETKNNLVAQGLGMGIDPMKMQKYVNDGRSLKEIAQLEGLDYDNLPPPIYFPTTTTKTRVQQVQQVGNELDYLSSATTPLIKQYADTFAGYSPERISDMLSRDPEAQKRFGQYIGALSVQTGLANGRVLLEGGKSGVEIMREVKNSAIKGIDQHTPIKMSKVAYEEAQKTIDRILQRGAKIRNLTGMAPFSPVNEKGGADQGETVTRTWVRDKSGKLVREG